MAILSKIGISDWFSATGLPFLEQFVLRRVVLKVLSRVVYVWSVCSALLPLSTSAYWLTCILTSVMAAGLEPRAVEVWSKCHVGIEVEILAGFSLEGIFLSVWKIVWVLKRTWVLVVDARSLCLMLPIWTMSRVVLVSVQFLLVTHWLLHRLHVVMALSPSYRAVVHVGREFLEWSIWWSIHN